jgi:hypothetical protein
LRHFKSVIKASSLLCEKKGLVIPRTRQITSSDRNMFLINRSIPNLLIVDFDL